jgi:hypothetical protein
MARETNGQVYIQRDWKDEALLVDGFQSYYPVKRITMMRLLPLEEAPETMASAGNIVTAEAGYWVAYEAGYKLKETLDEYHPRPIEPNIFARTYRLWDEPKRHLTPPQAHLQRLGCQAYYKTANVWAKLLTTEVWVQSIESAEPTLVPAGEWLCIGVEGEPWSMTEVWFQAHYRLAENKRRIEQKTS